MIPINWMNPAVAAGVRFVVPLAIKGLSRFLNR
jgi:hypothetical protein